MLTELEKKIVSEVQGDIAVIARPYVEIAERLGIEEDVLLRTLKNLCQRGVIRRFGATLRHQKSGYTANAMTAWKVDEDRINEVGEKMASYRQVSHCYRRNPTPEWPYNLYTMIHAMDEESCLDIAKEISAETSVNIYTVLFSKNELKKTSMEYFPINND